MYDIKAINCIDSGAMGTKVWYPSTKFSKINRKAKYHCRFSAGDRQERMKSNWKRGLKEEKVSEITLLRKQLEINLERIKQLELKIGGKI